MQSIKKPLRSWMKCGYFVEDPDKGLIPSPLILTLEKATNNIRTSASRLGLTVDSRMKMFVPKEEKKEETLFDKFGGSIVTGKQIGRASCRERVLRLV